MCFDVLEVGAVRSDRKLLGPVDVMAVMPFGVKEDIDFRDIYNRVMERAATLAGVRMTLASEVPDNDIIHRDMFERLLGSEIVVADLTLLNPNVMYELGVRHALRKRSTIMLIAEGTRLPFDVTMVRAIKYVLTEKKLTDEEAERVAGELAARLELAVHGEDVDDSPVFQLVSCLTEPGVKPADLAAFRLRAERMNQIREELDRAKWLQGQEKIRRRVRQLEGEAEKKGVGIAPLLEEFLLAYRATGAWREMVRVVSRMPARLVSDSVLEYYGFALNRLGTPADRNEAIRVLRRLAEETPLTMKKATLLGRTYKDKYLELLRAGRHAEAAGHLDEAITWYRKGFELELGNPYPGINAAALLLQKGTKEALSEMDELLTVVSVGLKAQKGLEAPDYFVRANVMEAAVLLRQWPQAQAAAQAMLATPREPRNLEATLQNLRMNLDGLARQGHEVDAGREILAFLEAAQGLRPKAQA